MADIKSIASFIPANRLEIDELVSEYHQISHFNYRLALRLLKKSVNRFRKKSLNSVRWIYNQRLLLREKVVPGPNEDALTAGVQSLNNAIKRAGIKPHEIDALFVVSESFPYAVGSSTKIAGKVGATNLKYGSRGEFACKPFGEFIDIAAALIDSGRCRYVAITATDASQGAPGDDLEFSASFYSTSIILGPDNTGIAEIKGRTSVNYDFSDFIRKEGHDYPDHEGQGTSFAFRGMILSAMKKHLERYKDIKPESLPKKTWVIHSPNGSFPNEALVDISNYYGVSLAEKVFDENGKMLGIKPNVKVSNLAPKIANGYSATVPTAICAAMESCKSDEEIMAVFYGSGAGSDIITIKMRTDGAQIANCGIPTVEEQIETKQKITVEDYFKLRDGIDNAARHIALLDIKTIGKEFYEVQGCPKCGAIYFGDSWTRDNFPDFSPPEKFKKLEGRCFRGVQHDSSDAKRICGEKLVKVKLPKRAVIKNAQFYSPKRKNGARPENPYWVMFEQHLVRGFNYNPHNNLFVEGEEVEAIIGRWRPDPKNFVPYLYVPMYQVIRKEYKE
ncbi:MAG: hypothetical protein ACTSR2_03650 [Candidatus Hodarchaeales archaeon]